MAGKDPTLERTLRQLTARRVPGISAAVVGPQGVERLLSAGYADRSTGARATSETLYLWFSMTKIVTATAALQLAEQGALSVDHPVQHYLPEFPKPGAGWPPVLVRHLLSHSGGLPNPIPVRWVHAADAHRPDPHEFASRLLKKHGRLRFYAGSKAIYSNLGYIALGEVIASVSGQTFEDYVRDRILKPLSMTRTDFAYPPGPGQDVATGYQRRWSPMTPVLRHLLPEGIIGEHSGRFVAFNRFYVDGPAYGGLVGSVSDAARFLAAHLNGGELGGVHILDPRTVKVMQTTQARGRKLDAGYGWYRRGRGRRTGTYWEHLGGGGGFRNVMRLYPEEGVGIVAMGNATAYNQDAIAQAVRTSR